MRNFKRNPSKHFCHRRHKLQRAPTFTILPFLLTITILLLSRITLSLAFEFEDNGNGQPAWIAYPKKVLTPLKKKYDTLPPKGKFATGALAGFTATRVVASTAIKGAKIVGVAFVASEVLNYAGLLDVDELMKENADLVNRVQKTFKTNMDKVRVQIRHHLNPNSVKGYIETAVEKDRMGTLGLATGIASGILL